MSIQNPFMKIVNTHKRTQPTATNPLESFHIGRLKSSPWYNFQGLALNSR